MAAPITSIKWNELTPQEIKQNKLGELQSLIAEQDQALNKILEITGELDDAGVFDALKAMVKAKADIAKIAVDQASRDPVTNIINHVLHATSVISSIDPDVTAKLAASVKSGLNEAELYSGNGQKVSIFQLMTALNDPDTNRAVKFGLDFLKGMGKGLE
ncbi:MULTISPECIES: DUF1641 domain-containing protein [unclassified Sporosarcina]|uniref:DUF1641 domain-containing protein n=1 Tax=unclassified Sporosarcina TaxID=2647733 RepID=UPI00164E8A02|nr:DUF1641 domain-containing protein [Sporosarcina sp. resist]QNK90263.1 DUF1641 domain-containing protein [Sporosarcina sp. resist]